MAILMHPRLILNAESAAFPLYTTYNQDEAHLETTRYTRTLEDKPALLVVTDATGNILLSLVGKTKWSTESLLTDDATQLAHQIVRRNSGWLTKGSSTTINDDLRQPLVPTLEFFPFVQYAASIRQSGTIAKAYVLVDTTETYSVTDESTWPAAYYDGSTAFDVATLPDTLRYLQVSVGDLASDQALRFTYLDLNVNDTTVQMADPSLRIHLVNLFRDWSTAKDELTSLLGGVTSVGTSLEDIAAKEAAAAEAVAAAE